MPSPDEPVETTPPESAQATQGTGAVKAKTSGAWLLPSLLALVALALAVIFWLPDYVDSRVSVNPQPQGQESTAASPASTDTSSIEAHKSNQVTDQQAAKAGSSEQQKLTPWADAQQAKLRLEAQNTLAELLDIQFALEENRVDVWGRNAFSDAAQKARKGDEDYRSRNYKQAIEHYRESLNTLQELDKSKSRILAENLATTEEYLQAGNSGSALASIAIAKAIDASDPGIAVLEHRIETLPQVLSLLSEASQKELAGDITAAAALLEKASALDPLHQSTASSLERANSNLRDQQFRSAMSNGYLALENGHLDEALGEFEKARTLNKSSAIVAEAIIEVQNARTTSTLARLRAEGAAFEKSEQWSRAVKTYTSALNMDASLTYAVEGLKRSEQREKLDLQFHKIMTDPDRLSEPKIAQEATDFLAQLNALAPRGKILQTQIIDLEALLQRARTPVKVKLISDEETEVVVYKVARLGKFRQHELTLRPGTYTAVGTRNGYRDVRTKISVTPEQATQTVSIVCTEAI